MLLNYKIFIDIQPVPIVAFAKNINLLHTEVMKMVFNAFRYTD
jgi:hypothetical protein